jgi:hypothetical protein
VVASATTVCNPGSGDICDPDESCSGVAGEACPADSVAPATTICNPGSGDICDPAESCTGNPDEACPDDTIAPATTICRPGTNACDPGESCPGTADVACPPDVSEDLPTLTVTKTLVNDDGGVADLDDFYICLTATQSGSDFDECFWGDETPISYVLDPEVYSVTEDLGDLAFYYGVSFAGDCAPGGGGVLACDADYLCEVINDDIDVGQRSISVNDVDACQNEVGTTISGSWVVNDETNSDRRMDGVLVLVDDYETDFDWKADRRAAYSASDFDADWFVSDGDGGSTDYSCTYTVTSDLDPAAPVTCQESDCLPVEFDETLTVEYTCVLSPPGVPTSGYIRVHGTVEAQSRGPQQVFTAAMDWPLSGRPSKVLPICPAP